MPNLPPDLAYLRGVASMLPDAPQHELQLAALELSILRSFIKARYIFPEKDPTPILEEYVFHFGEP